MLAVSARWSAILTMLVIVFHASAAHAESAVELSSSVESAGIVPTSSTKQLLVTLQLMVPFTRAAGTRLFAGLGPVAMTRQLLSATVPELVAFGGAGSFRLEF